MTLWPEYPTSISSFSPTLRNMAVEVSTTATLSPPLATSSSVRSWSTSSATASEDLPTNISTEANEEAYPTEVEPWEPNITTLADFKGKWENLIPKDAPRPTPVSEAAKWPVGLYEGGGYVSHGVYRPADNCRMRTNTAPDFCPACRQALCRLIDFYTGDEL